MLSSAFCKEKQETSWIKKILKWEIADQLRPQGWMFAHLYGFAKMHKKNLKKLNV